MTEDDGYVPDIDLTGGSEAGTVAIETDAPDEDAADANPPDEDAADANPPDEDAADAPAMDATDDEVEPVELLVQLAEEGEIEPWDIDIVQVTDAFLAELDARDLRTTGRALFYASVLLRMKSDAMLSEDDEDGDDEPELEPWEAAMRGEAYPGVGDGDGESTDGHGFDPVDRLEAEMDRRLERKNTRGSPETLDELVRELREAERGSWWKRSREYDTSESPRGHDRGTQTLDYRAAGDVRREGEPTEGDVTGGTHDEDIEEVIDDVRGVLRTQYDQGRAEVLFAEIETVGGRPFMTYLALLFLAHRGGVRLQQDDLFGDLWIRDPTAATVEAEAIAD
ncbi:segregation and condensation protein A [Halopenitus persicus]|uniref:segregation and condensation protein A n=1 Tax=Halopenitus persicus TaxID=1048396 RepID=UPI000BBA7424|nr:ScpA family protein [Halopenitus persicus]